MDNVQQKIVTIGGGSGQFVLLSGLRDIEGIEITVIVSMTDNGGSTGRLRDEFDMLPPGDILKCLLALSPYRDIAQQIFLKRFTTHSLLKGHYAGNMLLIMLSQYTGNFVEGVRALIEILDVRGTVLPVSLNKTTLVAELADGSRIYGEKAIDIPLEKERERIVDIFLVPHNSESISAYSPVIDAINKADYIFISPGDLFTSIIPNFIVPGIKNALHNTKAKIIYIVNIMTKFGETDHFTGYDFVKTIEKFMEKQIDGIIYNTEKPPEHILQQSLKQRAEFVEIDEHDEGWENYTVYASDILDISNDVVQHDSKKLALLIQEIIL